MVKAPHIGMSNATRCKNYRQRKKKAQLIAKDNIEKQLEQHINEKKQEKTDIIEQKGVKISSLEANSREPQRDLVDQYQQTEPDHYDFWGRKEGIESPLDKISIQKQLRAIHGDKHSE